MHVRALYHHLSGWLGKEKTAIAAHAAGVLLEKKELGRPPIRRPPRGRRLQPRRNLYTTTTLSEAALDPLKSQSHRLLMAHTKKDSPRGPASPPLRASGGAGRRHGLGPRAAADRTAPSSSHIQRHPHHPRHPSPPWGLIR